MQNLHYNIVDSKRKDLLTKVISKKKIVNEFILDHSHVNLMETTLLTRLETFYWLQFDDITSRKTEQTFVIRCKTLDCDHMTGILRSGDGQALGILLARFLLSCKESHL